MPQSADRASRKSGGSARPGQGARPAGGGSIRSIHRGRGASWPPVPDQKRRPPAPVGTISTSWRPTRRPRPRSCSSSSRAATRSISSGRLGRTSNSSRTAGAGSCPLHATVPGDSVEAFAETVRPERTGFVQPAFLMPLLLRLAAARPRFVPPRISLGRCVLIQLGGNRSAGNPCRTLRELLLAASRDEGG